MHAIAAHLNLFTASLCVISTLDVPAGLTCSASQESLASCAEVMAQHRASTPPYRTDGTLLDFHEDEVAARQSILSNCRKSFLVLDHSKFGRIL